MLYEPAQFEPLADEPWDPARVENAIATIVADADAASDPDALWPAHEWDGWQAPLPMKNLYVGAAGVIWALDEVRRRGHAETSLDLADAALRTLELWCTEPDFMAGETHSHPGALLRGETGPLLIAFRLDSDPALADDLHALVRANVANPTDDVMWGAPGTLLAALAMGEWTGEPRWEEAAHETAAELRARRGDDWLWRQDDDYRGLGAVHGAAGNTLVLLRLEPDDALAACAPRGLRWSHPSPVVHRRSRRPRRRLGVSRRRAPARRSRVDLASRRPRRREGPRHLPRHFGQRLRAPQGIRAHR